jgi:hypothetical protein
VRVSLSIFALSSLVISMVLFNSIPAQANTGPACDSLQERACSVVKPPAPAPPPGGGSGGGGGSDSGGSGGGGRGGSGGGGSGGGGSGGGGAELPECSYEEVGHLCVSDPGPGDGGGGGGGAPARPAPPTRIPESQFQSFDIPAPTIYAWPKDWAVVGKPAAFWTDTEVSYIDMTLLTYAVTVKVTPERFHWDFGDDTGKTTSAKGEKPPPGSSPQIGHEYQKSGTVSVSMTATFSGEFSVDGGPWLPIDGFAHVASNEIGIDVYRYHRYLVDEDCYANPRGPDCT